MFDVKLCRVWLVLACSIATSIAACGDGSEDGGSGGEGSGMVGEPCTTSCAAGLVCGGSLFPGICTVQCGSDSACQQHAIEARCFGAIQSECALQCEADGDCPTGTTCKDFPGGTSPKACMR